MARLSDMDRIKLFRRLIADLREKRFLNSGGGKFTLNVIGGGPCEIRGLDGDHLDAFLVSFRQLMLPKDQNNLLGISAIVQRACGRPELQAWCVYLDHTWTVVLDQPGEIEINGQRRTMRKLLALFIYSGLAHMDHDKVEELETLDGLLRSVLKLQLLAGLGPLLQIAAQMDRVIWHWLDGPGEPVPPPPRTLIP